MSPSISLLLMLYSPVQMLCECSTRSCHGLCSSADDLCAASDSHKDNTLSCMNIWRPSWDLRYIWCTQFSRSTDVDRDVDSKYSYHVSSSSLHVSGHDVLFSADQLHRDRKKKRSRPHILFYSRSSNPSIFLTSQNLDGTV